MVGTLSEAVAVHPPKSASVSLLSKSERRALDTEFKSLRDAVRNGIISESFADACRALVRVHGPSKARRKIKRITGHTEDAVNDFLPHVDPGVFRSTVNDHSVATVYAVAGQHLKAALFYTRAAHTAATQGGDKGKLWARTILVKAEECHDRAALRDPQPTELASIEKVGAGIQSVARALDGAELRRDR